MVDPIHVAGQGVYPPEYPTDLPPVAAGEEGEVPPPQDLNVAAAMCHLGSVFEFAHDHKIRGHHATMQKAQQNQLLHSQCIAAIEKNRNASDGETYDLSDMREALCEAHQVYCEIAGDSPSLQAWNPPEDFSSVPKEKMDDMIRLFGEAKVLSQGKSTEIMAQLRCDVEVMLIVMQALQKMVEHHTKLVTNINNRTGK